MSLSLNNNNNSSNKNTNNTNNTNSTNNTYIDNDSIVNDGSYESLLKHIKKFLIINKVKKRIEDLITDENDHLILYKYLIFEFSESVSQMVTKYIIEVENEEQTQNKMIDINETINEYRFGRIGVDKEVNDIKLRTLVYKIAQSEFKITKNTPKIEFIEHFMDTPDLINFTINFISKIVKYHNFSSLSGSYNSSSSTTTITANSKIITTT